MTSKERLRELRYGSVFWNVRRLMRNMPKNYGKPGLRSLAYILGTQDNPEKLLK